MATNYPNKSFARALEIAEQVSKLGGKCNLHTLADKLGIKIGGSFHDDVNAAIKFDLISKEKDQLRLSDRYTQIELAYSEEEKQEYLKKAFISPDLYKDILNRFRGKSLPIDVLDKMLIREYNVSKSISKTVANNLIKGGEMVGLIVGGKVTDIEPIETNDQKEASISQITEPTGESQTNNKEEELVEKKSDEENMPLRAANIAIPSTEALTSGANMTLNINIQLTVPETTNEEVYEKFFAAMKKHLLS